MKNYINRPLLIIVLSFLFSLMASSRVLFLDQSDDLIRYYQAYSSININDINAFINISNRELLFQYYNVAIYYFFGELSARVYLFLMVLPTSFFYVCSLFKVKNIFGVPTYLVIFSIFAPAVLMHDSQLIRQAMSMSILFLALLVENKKIKWFLVFLSFGIHAVSIVFYLLYRVVYFIFSKGLIKPFLIIIAFLVVSGSFLLKKVLSLLEVIPFISGKLGFILNIPINYVTSPIYVVSIFSVLFFIFKYRPGNDKQANFYILLSAIFIVFIFCFPYVELAQRFSVYLNFYILFVLYMLIKAVICSVNKNFKLMMINVDLIVLNLIMVYVSVVFFRYLLAPSPFTLFNGIFLL